MKEIFKWRDIKPGCIFVSRNQSLLGKCVAFWADGWSHCGIIYEEDDVFKTIEAKRRIIIRPLSDHYHLWERGDLRIFDPEARCWDALTNIFEKVGDKYDWFGDVLLFFALPIQQAVWHMGYSYRVPIPMTDREKCSENVLLYLRDLKATNPKIKAFRHMDFMPAKDACVPADIIKGCEEMCLLSKRIRK